MINLFLFVLSIRLLSPVSITVSITALSHRWTGLNVISRALMNCIDESRVAIKFMENSDFLGFFGRSMAALPSSIAILDPWSDP